MWLPSLLNWHWQYWPNMHDLHCLHISGVRITQFATRRLATICECVRGTLSTLKLIQNFEKDIILIIVQTMQWITSWSSALNSQSETASWLTNTISSFLHCWSLISGSFTESTESFPKWDCHWWNKDTKNLSPKWRIAVNFFGSEIFRFSVSRTQFADHNLPAVSF